FSIPLALGLVIVGTYNFLRFDNPLDFGMFYGLTAKDQTRGIPFRPAVVWEREIKTLPIVLFYPPLRYSPTHLTPAPPAEEVLIPPHDYVFFDPTVGVLVVCQLLVLLLLSLS